MRVAAPSLNPVCSCGRPAARRSASTPLGGLPVAGGVDAAAEPAAVSSGPPCCREPPGAWEARAAAAAAGCWAGMSRASEANLVPVACLHAGVAGRRDRPAAESASAGDTSPLAVPAVVPDLASPAACKALVLAAVLAWRGLLGGRAAMLLEPSPLLRSKLSAASDWPSACRLTCKFCCRCCLHHVAKCE